MSKAKRDDGKGLYVRRRTNCRDSCQSRGKSRSKSRGGRLKCYIFQSEDHLKRNCPKNNRKKSTSYVKKDEQPSSNCFAQKTRTYRRGGTIGAEKAGAVWQEKSSLDCPRPSGQKRHERVFNKVSCLQRPLKDSVAMLISSLLRNIHVEVKLQRLNNHTPEEDQTDQEDGNDEDAGDQKTDQTPDLTDYKQLLVKNVLSGKPAMKEEIGFSKEEQDLGVQLGKSWSYAPDRDYDVERMGKVPYANSIRSLMYLMVCMRPDIAYAVSVFSRYLANQGKNHWEAVKWILKYLRGTANVGLMYGTDHGNHVDVTSFVDSDYTKDSDKGRSITGYTFLVQGCVVTWKAMLQHVVALSTTEAEYMALTEAVKEAIWLRGLLEELGIELNTMAVNCDNQGTNHLSRNHVFHERTKHINVRYQFIRKVLEANTIKVLKVGTEHNVVDALTKVHNVPDVTNTATRLKTLDVVHVFQNQEQHVNNEQTPHEENNLPTQTSEPVGITLNKPARVRKSAIPNDYIVYLQETDFDIGIDNDFVSFSQAIKSYKSEMWIDAMKEELKSMAQNKFWDLVHFSEGSKRVGCKWIFNVERYKARLVAKDYTQKNDVDYNETFSPVSKNDSLRLKLALVAHFELYLHEMDVKIAFLNENLEKEVYLEQREWFFIDGKEKMVCKLKKSIYGLNQASRQRAWGCRKYKQAAENEIQKQRMHLEHISTDLMIADHLTKGLPPKAFTQYVPRLGLGCIDN
ncbi:retrovirus-related pol polyprotein from transposon TNT 1-94 [Tanacetum coccineum]